MSTNNVISVYSGIGGMIYGSEFALNDNIIAYHVADRWSHGILKNNMKKNYIPEAPITKSLNCKFKDEDTNIDHIVGHIPKNIYLACTVIDPPLVAETYQISAIKQVATFAELNECPLVTLTIDGNIFDSSGIDGDMIDKIIRIFYLAGYNLHIFKLNYFNEMPGTHILRDSICVIRAFKCTYCILLTDAQIKYNLNKFQDIKYNAIIPNNDITIYGKCMKTDEMLSKRCSVIRWDIPPLVAQKAIEHTKYAIDMEQPWDQVYITHLGIENKIDIPMYPDAILLLKHPKESGGTDNDRYEPILQLNHFQYRDTCIKPIFYEITAGYPSGWTGADESNMPLDENGKVEKEKRQQIGTFYTNASNGANKPDTPPKKKIEVISQSKALPGEEFSIYTYGGFTNNSDDSDDGPTMNGANPWE